jgi:hypothetical protein
VIPAENHASAAIRPARRYSCTGKSTMVILPLKVPLAELRRSSWRVSDRMVYLWRAVDAEGEVPDVLVQAKRNKRAALKLIRKLLKNMALSQTSSSQMS